MSNIFTRHATALCRRAPNAVDVRYGVETSRGPLSLKDVEILNASGQTELRPERILTLPTDAFVAAVQRHSSIIVAGTTYKIRDSRRIEDGVLTQYFLAEVP